MTLPPLPLASCSALARAFARIGAGEAALDAVIKSTTNMCLKARPVIGPAGVWVPR